MLMLIGCVVQGIALVAGQALLPIGSDEIPVMREEGGLA